MRDRLTTAALMMFHEFVKQGRFETVVRRAKKNEASDDAIRETIATVLYSIKSGVIRNEIFVEYGYT